MTDTLRLVGDDTIELDGRVIARLLKPTLTVTDKLIAAFDFITDANDDIADLENRIAQLEEQLGRKGKAP